MYERFKRHRKIRPLDLEESRAAKLIKAQAKPKKLGKEITTTTTLYRFSELVAAQELKLVSSSAVDNARQWYWDGMDSHYADYVTDVWKAALDQIGFLKAEIFWSGFSSQGDGACFTCTGVDMQTLITFMTTKVKPKNCIEPTKRLPIAEDFWPWLAYRGNKPVVDKRYKCLLEDAVINEIYDAHIQNSDSRYSHGGTCKFEAQLTDFGEDLTCIPKNIYGIFESFVEEVEDYRYRLCDYLYKDLEEEYNHQISDEMISDMSDANDWRFNRCGHYVQT